MTEPNAAEQDWKDIAARFERATEVQAGITIQTKDGRITGNAYIVEQCGTGRTGEPDLNPQPMWTVETDFGNRIKLSQNEIEERFYLGFAQPYQEWFDARLNKIRGDLTERS